MFLVDSFPAALRVPDRRGGEHLVTLELERTSPHGAHDPYVQGLRVRVDAPSVRLEHDVVLLLPADLPAWLRGLYDEDRGWPGQRTWRSPDDDLRLAARHDGHVHLRWEVTRVLAGERRWTFGVTTHHEAGEELRLLADDLATLLEGTA